MKFNNVTMKQKVAALIATGTMATATLASPMAALAIDASADEQIGTGSTDVYVQMAAGSSELGGNTDPNNPDGNDADDWGDNIAFSVPSAINFVANAAGELTGPTVEIQNHSSFGIYASSFDVDAQGGWSIIGNGAAPTVANSADFQFGPSDAQLDAYDYLTKGAVADVEGNDKAAAFNMAADDGKVTMTTTGDIFKVDKDIATEKSKIATIKTFVKQGAFSAL